MKEIPILFGEEKDCCGCAACFSICPKSAIQMSLDENGFIYPIIDHEKCIKCWQCVIVCPIKKAANKKNKD